MAAGGGDEDVRPGAGRGQRVPSVLAAGAATGLLSGDVDEGERRAGDGGPVGVLHGAADGDAAVRGAGVRHARVAVRGVRGRVGEGGVVGHQWFLLEEEGDEQAEDEHRHEVQEDARHGVGVGLDVGVAQFGRQRVHELRCDRVGVHRRGARVRGEALVERVGEPPREEGAEDGGADAAADLPEVVVGAGRGAEVGGAHGVLHGEDQHRHHHADAGAEHGHPDAVVQPGRAGLQAGEQPHPGDGQGAADDGVAPVAAGAADQLAGDDRGADDAAHHGQHQQSGLGGGGPLDHLKVRRQIAGGAEQGDAGHQADQAGDDEDGVPEQPQRDEGFGGAALGDEEEDGGRGGARAEAEHGTGVPGVLGASPAGQQHRAGRGGGEQQGAQEVEAGPGGRFGELEHQGDDDHGDEAERHVDVEAPAPGEVVGEVAAEQRSGHGREAEGGADQPHEAAALPRGHDVGHDRLDADQQSARADALHRAVGDQLVHGRRAAGQRGADDEDEDGELEDALAAQLVAELAVDGQSDGGGEEIGGEGPGHAVQAVQLADDLRERGGDDHLLEGGEQQREHQRDEDEADPARAQGRLGGRCRGRRAAGRWRRGRLLLRQSDPAHVPLPSSHRRSIPA